MNLSDFLYHLQIALETRQEWLVGTKPAFYQARLAELQEVNTILAIIKDMPDED